MQTDTIQRAPAAAGQSANDAPDLPATAMLAAATEAHRTRQNQRLRALAGVAPNE